MKYCRFITDWFAIWILAIAAVSFQQPSAFLWVLPHINLMLSIVMFGMGMTLSAAEIKTVLKQPRNVFVGAAAQYLIMPFLGYLIARALHLPGTLAVGVILLGACPGGTASNVITFLAKGDVALSIAMTTTSTLLAPLLTPVLTFLLAGRWMHVAAGALFVSILQIIVIPIVLGAAANYFFSRHLAQIKAFLPVLSIVAILLIVAAIVGKEADAMRHTAPLAAAAVVLHNSGGLGLGWLAGSALKMGVPQRRALSIEVGMQNSGLAMALAMAHLPSEAALPAALFSIWHNISGPLLATIWARQTDHPTA